MFRHLLIFGALFLGSLSSLAAYQPGKWSHTDLYVLKDVPGGPKGLVVRDAKGTVIKRASYTYNKRGRLMSEVYFDASGKREGKTLYRYEGGRLVAELLYSRADKLLNQTLFTYEGKDLATLKVVDQSGKVLIRKVFKNYRHRIVGGKEITGEEEDPFRMVYEDGRLQKVQVINVDGSAMSEVRYEYDGRGRLKEREREVGENRSLCRYDYAPDGRLRSYAFFFHSNAGWVLEKSLTLEY